MKIRKGGEYENETIYFNIGIGSYWGSTIIGHRELFDTKTGAKIKTGVNSIIMVNGKRKVIWSVP